MVILRYLPILLFVGFSVGCTCLKDPRSKAAIYNPTPVSVQEGIASWYGGRDIGRLTANGEHYRANDITAAHKKLPFNSKVRVTNLSNGKSVIVRINDRGPYIKGRIIDLTVVPARQIGLYERGLAKVRVEVLREIPILEKSNRRASQVTSNKPAVPSGSLKLAMTGSAQESRN